MMLKTTRRTTAMWILSLAAPAAISLVAGSATAQSLDGPLAPAAAQPLEPTPSTWPRIGGHLGVAIPIVRVTNDGTTAIGHDFVNIGISPGVTIKLNPQWSIDLEFVAYANWQVAHGATPAASTTSFVLDPGVIWNPGPIALGVRSAIAVGEGMPFNMGVIPIIVKGIPISPHVNWFFELDLPVFVTVHAQQTVVSFGPQLQTGVAF